MPYNFNPFTGTLDYYQASSGGSGSPGGSNTQVQFNDSSSFGGDSQFVWDKTNHRLGIGAASTGGKLEASLGSIRALDTASGSYVGPSVGTGFEMAMVDSTGYLVSYKRADNTCRPLQIYASDIFCYNQGQALELRVYGAPGRLTVADSMGSAGITTSNGGLIFTISNSYQPLAYFNTDTSNPSLGINTYPTDYLDVLVNNSYEAGLTIRGLGSAQSASIRLKSNGGTSGFFRNNVNTAAVELGTTGYPIIFYTNSDADINSPTNERMRLTAAGLFGVGVTPTGNGLLQVKAGTSSGISKVGGTIFDHYADVGNVTTGETDLYSDTTPASVLTANGDKLEAEYGGVFVSSATATREIKLYFGGTVIFDTGALTLSLSSAWTMYASIIRVSSTVVRYMISFTTEGAALAAYTAVGELTGLTLSNTNILKITGQAAGVGAATNDIVAKLSSVSWQSAA